ncbi:MAG TPA: phosphate acyltransferase PlsX [Symbiobacteriaceae bacterium]
MKIAIDAMGGDNAPGAEVQGAIAAAREWTDLELVLVGDEPRLKAEAARHGGLPGNVAIVHASEVITTHEEPTKAFRAKKDASLVVAARMVKEGRADALLTAGSTGAMVVVGTLVVGRMKGIERPALGTIFPTVGDPTFILDIGATPDCKPEWLVQFALIGDVYAREILGLKNPTVALLNIGVEEEKGNLATKATYELLKGTKSFNFVGNVEARDVPWGKVNVVVADGFPGNVFLKTFEGVGTALIQSMKDAMTATTISKIGALLVKPGLKKMLKKFDYTEYGGALLLGLKAPVVKCHGSSEAKGIKSGIRVMRAALAGRVIEKLGSSIAHYEETQTQK